MLKGIQVLATDFHPLQNTIWLAEEETNKARCLASKEFYVIDEIYGLDELDIKQSREIPLESMEFKQGCGQHININVMTREMLLDAQKNPDKYPQLTVRVSGFAVRFNALTLEQQNDVINRTITEFI